MASNAALRYLAANIYNGPVSLVLSPVMESKIVLSEENHYTIPRSAGAASWLPDCSHWTIAYSSRSSVPIARISLDALRRYWYPARNIISSRMGPSLKLRTNLLLLPPSS